MKIKNVLMISAIMILAISCSSNGGLRRLTCLGVQTRTIPKFTCNGVSRVNPMLIFAIDMSKIRYRLLKN